MRCDPTPACEWLSILGAGGFWLKSEVEGKNNSLHPPMVARGSRTKRGGRSLAAVISSWELRLAEAADYLLRAALGVQPRPHWGPFWLLPASRAELENYLAAVAESCPESDVESEISDE